MGNQCEKKSGDRQEKKDTRVHEAKVDGIRQGAWVAATANRQMEMNALTEPR
jgi:hypothetical protein